MSAEQLNNFDVALIKFKILLRNIKKILELLSSYY